MSPEFRAAERVTCIRLVCADCGGPAQGNVSYSDGSGEVCDSCAAADDGTPLEPAPRATTEVS